MIHFVNDESVCCWYNPVMDLTTRQDANTMTTVQDMLHEQQEIIAKKSTVIAQQKRRIEILEEYLRLAKQKRFGRSSEKNPNQDEMFNEAELAAYAIDDIDPEDDKADTSTDKPAPKKRGRKGFSKNIPREQIYIDLPAEEKLGAIDTFYSKVREELDIEPAKVRVLEYMQEKAVFMENGNRQIKAATLPKHPIAKTMASIGLLAHIIVSKYMDGLPLYRQEGILRRFGGDVTRTSMANWIIRLALQCQPLVHVLREQQHRGPLIQIDETRIQVLKELGYLPTGHKYMWVTVGGPPGHPVVLFYYDPSRSHEVPLRLLDGYEGYLQSDGYSGYDKVCGLLTLAHLGCWDHCRRKFKEAQTAQPKTAQGRTKADIALIKIGKLYKIEREIKDLPVYEKHRERQQRSKPVLDDLKRWMTKHMGKAPKDALISIALVYMNNQWKKLVRYCEDGNLPISNIIAENAIRPFVIGRKAWLFADTPKGAHASGIFYSLIETARANELEPYAYLRHIFEALPYADTVEKIEALLPWNVKNQVTPLKIKQKAA